ncbi:MAG: hypothetical protein ABI878_11290 [Acidobacteriota bacterium]
MSVTMLFDRARSRIGLRPSRSEVLNAYRLKGSRQGKRLRPCVIHVKAFCNTYGIKLRRTIRFADPRSENGILVLDLPPNVRSPEPSSCLDRK